jgi:alkylation response protein AidB-like acyl-CoA dehydrogenase
MREGVAGLAGDEARQPFGPLLRARGMTQHAKSLVLHGDSADRLIVSARTAGSRRDRDGIGLFLVVAGLAGDEARQPFGPLLRARGMTQHAAGEHDRRRKRYGREPEGFTKAMWAAYAEQGLLAVPFSEEDRNPSGRFRSRRPRSAALFDSSRSQPHPEVRPKGA